MYVFIFKKQSWAMACDNNDATTETLFSGSKNVDYGLITIQYSSWQLHLDTGALTFFVFFLVSDAPLRCRGRCREAKKTVACPALLKRGKENKFSQSKRKVTLGPIELFYNSINQSIRPLLTPRSIIKITDMRCTVQYSI